MSKLQVLYDFVPARALMRAERAYGGALSAVANHPAGHRVVDRAHRGAARMIGAAVQAARLVDGEDAVTVAKQTMARFFGPILGPDQVAAPDRWTFSFTRCPYGLAGPSQAPLCHAIMRLEEELVRTLGGELVIEQRIAEGAPQCRFTVRNVG